MVPVAVAQEECRGLDIVLSGQRFAKVANARSGIEDKHLSLMSQHADAGGVASVPHGLVAGHRHSAACAPESYLHESSYRCARPRSVARSFRWVFRLTFTMLTGVDSTLYN